MTDKNTMTGNKRVKELEKIIRIQELIIKTNNHSHKISRQTNEQQIKTFEGLLERNYSSNTRVVHDLLYWKDMAEHLYRRLAHEITTNTMKGKKKNVEEKNKKTKRGAKSK